MRYEIIRERVKDMKVRTILIQMLQPSYNGQIR